MHYKSVFAKFLSIVFFEGDEKIFALVIRTGYLTTKGELVRSILYPPPADFKFETDSYKFIAMLSVIAVAAVIYTIVSKVSLFLVIFF